MKEKIPGKNLKMTGYFLSFALVSATFLVAIAVVSSNPLQSTYASSYAHDPFFTATGSKYYDVPSSTSLQPTEFSLAAWFKTSQTPSLISFIANKGGTGTDSEGKNLNYGIWLTKTGQIEGGFEDKAGKNHWTTSPSTYNDGDWHFAVLTYGGHTINLYIDGERVAYKDIQATPDNTGTQDFRVGANSLFPSDYFVGSVDEVIVYNRPLTDEEATELFNSGSTSASGEALRLSFGITTTGGSTTDVSSGTKPSAPTGLKVSVTSSTSLSLTWNSVAEATGYNVYRYSNEVSTKIKVNSSPVIGTTFKDPGLVGGVTYYYQVTAINQYGKSSPSSTVSATTPPSGYLVTVSRSDSTFTARDSAGKTLATSSDAATVIQAALNAVKAKGVGGTVRLNDAVYPIKKSIYLSGINGLTFEGENRDGTILRCAVVGLDIVTKNQSTATKEMTIRKLTIDGANISDKLVDMGSITNLVIDNIILERHNAEGPGGYIVDVYNSVIKNSIIRNAYNKGDTLAVKGTELKILNNEFYGKQARITSGSMQDSELAYNYFHDLTASYAAISMENYNDFRNIKIHHNRFEDLSGNGIHSLGWAGGGDGGFDNIQIYDNTFIDIAGAAVKLNAFSEKPNVITYNSKIYNNKITNTHYSAIYVGPMKNCEIYNNTITTTITPYGIHLYAGSNDVTMDRNNITGAEKNKYYYSGSTEIYINGQKVA
jgi:hypothetical protein